MTEPQLEFALTVNPETHEPLAVMLICHCGGFDKYAPMKESDSAIQGYAKHYAQQHTRLEAALSPQQDGDWPEDFSGENGNYERECVFCGAHFRGYKRRVVCKLCETDPARRAIIKRGAEYRAQQGGALRALVARWRKEDYEVKGVYGATMAQCADELASVLGDAPGATPKERAT